MTCIIFSRVIVAPTTRLETAPTKEQQQQANKWKEVAAMKTNSRKYTDINKPLTIDTAT